MEPYVFSPNSIPCCVNYLAIRLYSDSDDCAFVEYPLWGGVPESRLCNSTGYVYPPADSQCCSNLVAMLLQCSMSAGELTYPGKYWVNVPCDDDRESCTYDLSLPCGHGLGAVNLFLCGCLLLRHYCLTVTVWVDFLVPYKRWSTGLQSSERRD